MADRPRVDVGVVTWNTSAITVGALRRLLDSEQGCELRLLVRDNGSVDGTAQAIASAVPEAALDAGVDNVGFAAGVNLLLARSDAPWFLALNSDAWPEPCAVRRLVEAAQSHPQAAAVAPRLERPDGTLEHSTHSLPSLAIALRSGRPGYSRRHPRAADALMLHGAWRHDQAREVGWAVGAALLMRRSAVEQVGGFDERLFLYAEDLEWCWRARRAGWSVWFEPSAVVRHLGNASAVQNYGERRSAAYWRNTYRVYRRYHGPLGTLAYRGVNLAGSAGGWLRARRRGADARHYWQGELRAHLSSPRGSDGPPGGTR